VRKLTDKVPFLCRLIRSPWYPGHVGWREAMKKSLIIATAMVACTVVLTFMPGLTQAQQPTEQVEEGRDVAEQIPGVQQGFVDPNRFFTGVCTVGPRSTDVNFTCFNIGFSSASPRSVHCQLRNSPADPTSYPDQFACQVIRTSPGSVTVRIRRIDDGTTASSWGQDLRLNLLIVD
jgi:hypothetical protein